MAVGGGGSAAAGQPSCVDAALVNDGATAVYPLDEPSGTSAFDVGPNHNTATIGDAASYDETPGPLSCAATDGALGFNGTTTAVTTPIAPTAPAVTGSALTVVAWVKGAAFPKGGGNSGIVADSDAGTGTAGGFQLAVGSNGDSGSFDVGTGAGVGTAPWHQALSAGTWYMVAGTYDGSTVTSYLDGTPVGSGPASGAIGGGSKDVTIGDDPVKTDDHFDGQIGDVAVLPGALSAAQNPEPLPLGRRSHRPHVRRPDPGGRRRGRPLPARRQRGTTAADISGNAETATISDAAAYDDVPGPLGCDSAADGALNFNGSSTHVTTPLAGTSGSLTGGALTVVAWVKPATPVPGPASGPETVLADADTASSDTGFSFDLTPQAGGGGFDLATTRTPGAQASWTRTSSLVAGTWYMVTGTYDGNAVTAYLDGAPVASTPATGPVAAGTSPLAIGVDPAGSTGYFDGQMADVAVLPGALSATQVSQLYQAGTGTTVAASWSGPAACGQVVTATPPAGAVSATVVASGGGGGSGAGAATGTGRGGDGGQVNGTLGLNHTTGEVSVKVGCGGAGAGSATSTTTGPTAGGAGYASGGGGGSATPASTSADGSPGGGGGGPAPSASVPTAQSRWWWPPVAGAAGDVRSAPPQGSPGQAGRAAGGSPSRLSTSGAPAAVDAGSAGTPGGGGTGGGSGSVGGGGTGGSAKNGAADGGSGGNTPADSVGGSGGGSGQAGGGGGGGGYTAGGGGGASSCTAGADGGGGGGGGSSAGYAAYQPDLAFSPGASGGSAGGSGSTGTFDLAWNLATVSLVTPPAQTSVAGAQVSLAVNGGDSAGLGLTYTATGLPPGLSMTPPPAPSPGW